MEKSPNLLQHKDNPVDWYPWSGEAFNKALAEDKPIFLSIGYSTCHWCHVMAHESFEDQRIAELLKEFVCIKVDREERPDIDSVYMSVCQALTGSGGWPLTVFMTPEQKPFFAGTYFPKKNRYGQIGLTELLLEITKLWNTQREELLKSGDKIVSFIQKERSSPDGKPDKALLRQGYRFFKNSFDEKWGGFARAPKFPTPHNLMFLMRIYELERKPEALQMVRTTLDAMASGGIFDHIGGGFSRYSTDEKWLVPHFEKMLYDNALLMLAYLEAFQLTGEESYVDTVRKTADFILRELTDKDGGFYCGQDADSDGVEGKYYVFTPDEVVNVLGEESGREFCEIYNITNEGNFEGKSIPNLIGKLGKGWKHKDARLIKLIEYRKRRAGLHLDNKILLSWNAWMIMAMVRAGSILNDGVYLDAAKKAHGFIKTHMTDEKNRLYLRFCDGEAAHRGQLDDYAVYALSLTELYRVTQDIEYLKEAMLRTEQMMELFEDKKRGGYYITSHDAESLIARPKETYDGAIPSGNSVAAMALENLARLTGKQRLIEAADRQQRFIAGEISEYPGGHAFALMAMANALYPKKELLYTGSSVPNEIIDHIRSHPAHDLSILYKSAENEEELSKLAPFTKDYPISEHTVWYLCENGACHAPVMDFSELEL